MKSKRSRKILVLFTSFMLVFGFALNANAADKIEISENVSIIGLGIDGDECGLIQPQYIPSCPGSSGKHLMRGRASGWAYYGAYPSKDLRLKGQASQCDYCNLVLITENNLFLNPSLPWGKYAMWNPGYQVGNGVVMYTTSFGEINSKTDPFAQGFTFN